MNVARITKESALNKAMTLSKVKARGAPKYFGKGEIGLLNYKRSTGIVQPAHKAYKEFMLLF